MKEFQLKSHLRNMTKPKSAVREWAESILIAFLLAMVIRTLFVQAFRIPSGSMEHTLEVGDRLLVNKLLYGPAIPFTHSRLPGFGKPERGDVIVFKYPQDPGKDFIKRLIALGGDTVQIRYGDIYINGKVLDVPKIKNIYYYNRGMFNSSDFSFKVPEGSYFVLGDNSGASHDSRYWGCVPEWMIVGKAVLIYWPLNRIRFIK